MKIAYVLDTFPVISQTFVVEELFGLRRRGFEVLPYALVHKQVDEPIPPAYRELEREMVFVPSSPAPLALLGGHVRLVLRHPLRYVSTFFWAWRKRLTRSPLKLAKTAWTLARGRQADKRSREDVFWHFVLVPEFANAMASQGVEHVHAHFADNSASFGLLCARLLGTSFSVTAHAFDIFTNPPLLPEKLARARFVTTCTTRGLEKLRAVASASGVQARLRLVYHGVDLEKFKPTAAEPGGVPILLSVGRLVPKKGFDVLLRATAELVQRGHSFELRIVGDGPEREKLEALRKELGLERIVRFLGSLSPEEMPEVYRKAHAFVLPSVIDARGDRDGIPNVAAEAMASGLPVVSTTVSAISDLVRDGVEGFLVPEKDVPALAAALEKLLKEPELRRRMGLAGRRRVEDVFDREKCIDELASLFRKELKREVQA
ncbi:MAG: colanic acid biosynthesis glycosyltransferase WcaL [Calditrichaeota bacterium]|nr:colanic acid biosynthesis glycosyltransferase WcaL [Calditrichota bacterium]